MSTDTEREIVSVGLDGASQPMRRYRDELHLPDRERTVPPRSRTAFVVVHTLGSGQKPDEYPDVERFEVDDMADFDFAYTDALDLAAEIREHEGHWARIDSVFADGSRWIR